MTFDFDASTVEPNTQFDPVPAGWYPCRIASVDLKKSGAGDDMLKFTFEVDHAGGAEFGGRKFFLNLVVGHKNEQPRAIAQRQLSAICRAVGVMKINEGNLYELCDRLLDVRVTIKRDVEYGDGNEVRQVREQLTRRGGQAAPAKFSHDATPKPKAGRQPVGGQDYGDIPF